MDNRKAVDREDDELARISRALTAIEQRSSGRSSKRPSRALTDIFDPSNTGIPVSKSVARAARKPASFGKLSEPSRIVSAGPDRGSGGLQLSRFVEHLGEVVPRRYLLASEQERYPVKPHSPLPRPVRVAPMLRSALAVRWGLGGFAAGLIGMGILHLAGNAAPEAMRVAGTSGSHWLPGITTAYAGAKSLFAGRDVRGPLTMPFRIHPAVADDSALSFVRFRGMPGGTKLSKGLEAGDGTWLLSKSQMSGLVVQFPRLVAGPVSIAVDFMRRDGSTIATMQYGTDAIGTGWRETGLARGGE